MDNLPFASVADIFGIMAGEKDTAVATTTSTGRRVLLAKGRISTAKVTPHGHADDDTCERIWRSIVSAYIGGGNEDAREELMNALAEVFVYGTSGEISWEGVSFQLKGEKHTMAALVSVVSENIKLYNPVRVWVRDFKRGELAVRMCEFLSTPENVELRQRAAAAYGMTTDQARYCFDTSDALLTSGLILSHSDMVTIKRAAAFVLSRADAGAISRGETQATSNHAHQIGGGKQTATVNTVTPMVSQEARGGFKALRA